MKETWILVTCFFISLLYQHEVSAQESWMKQGDILFTEGRYYDATYFYERALAENPANVTNYVKLAKCHLLVSPRSKSLTYINKAIELAGTPTLEMYYVLGRAYHLNNQFDNAIEAYRESDPEKDNFEEMRKLTRECLNAKVICSHPKTVEITNLGNMINTDHHEFLPYITADRLQLFFTSTRTGQITNALAEHTEHEDIFTSRFDNGTWTKPEIIASLNDLEGHDACAGISEDGQLMFVYKGTNGGDLYTSKLSGKDWSALKSLPINTSRFEGAASLSPDGNTLYFIRTSETGKDRDIYYCTKSLIGKWSAPVPIKELNTPYDEESPFIHPDGKTLYFSSMGHSNIGGFDIFKSIKKEDGTWSTPENIGYPINTTGDDMYFVLSADGTVGFYSSDKDGGYGRQDIYSIKMDMDSHYNLELLKGVVRDENGKTIEADIVVTDNSTRKVISKFKSNSENGKFLIALPCGVNYAVHIEQQGFIFHSEHVELDCQKGYDEVFKEIKLKKVHSGAKIILNNIFFDSGKSELKDESYVELQKIVSLLKVNPTIKIEISGYTDNVGAEIENKTLSQNRADHVKDFLVKMGVSEARIVSKGYGSSQPISSNAKEDGRRLNRRTEFKIL